MRVPRPLHAARWYAWSLLEQPAHRARIRARVLRPWRRLRFHSFGANSIVDRPAWVYGPGHIAIGRDVMILRGCWLAAEHWTWGETEPALVFGDRVAVRVGCTISASASIVFEDDVVLGARCSVVDSAHVHHPHDNVLRNGADAEPIRIGRGTWLADGVVVVKGAKIGAHCTIGANSVVRGEIPDHSVAVGAPARVVGTTRADSDPEERWRMAAQE